MLLAQLLVAQVAGDVGAQHHHRGAQAPSVGDHLRQHVHPVEVPGLGELGRQPPLDLRGEQGAGADLLGGGGEGRLELRRTGGEQHDPRLGAELPVAHREGLRQPGRDLLGPRGDGRLAEEDGVGAAHLGVHRDRLRSRRRRVVQCPAGPERPGEPDGLDGRIDDQGLPDLGTRTVQQGEDTGGETRVRDGLDDDPPGQLGGRRVRGMRLEHDGGARRQRRGGVTAGDREGEREVAGAEDGHRPERDLEAAQVGARRDRGGVRGVDGGVQVGAAGDQVSEHAELGVRPGQFAAQPGLAQRGLLVRRGDQLVGGPLDPGRDPPQQLGPGRRRGRGVHRGGQGRSCGRGTHLGHRRLVEGGALLTGGRAGLPQIGRPLGALLTGDEVGTGERAGARHRRPPQFVRCRHGCSVAAVRSAWSRPARGSAPGRCVWSRIRPWRPARAGSCPGPAVVVAAGPARVRTR